ncbi:unnamed protein product [Amoebophrya sp. A25]|nr:unnamed protein product [Amoebophrya sp. A25]|eukprot:GSA25T00016293001.1
MPVLVVQSKCTPKCADRTGSCTGPAAPRLWLETTSPPYRSLGTDTLRILKRTTLVAAAGPHTAEANVTAAETSDFQLLKGPLGTSKKKLAELMSDPDGMLRSES